MALKGQVGDGVDATLAAYLLIPAEMKQTRSVGFEGGWGGWGLFLAAPGG